MSETNVPDDVKWAGLDESQRTAVKRLYAWIRSCVPDGCKFSYKDNAKSRFSERKENSFFFPNVRDLSKPNAVQNKHAYF